MKTTHFFFKFGTISKIHIKTTNYGFLCSINYYLFIKYKQI